MADLFISLDHASDEQIKKHAHDAADAGLALKDNPFADPAKAQKWSDAFFARSQHNIREIA